MLQEYFWKNSDKLFFHFGHYSAQNKRNTKHSLNNLHLIDSIEVETKITSFEMICPSSDADVCIEACPSLLEWANYLLEPYADIESKDDSEVNSDNNQKGPILTYKISDDEIKWKKEPATETTQANALTPIIGEEWCKYDFDVEKKTKATLICNIANALKVCHSKYEKLKKLNNQQKHDHESIQLGMWSTFCLSTIDLPQCLYLFPMSWPCIS